MLPTADTRPNGPVQNPDSLPTTRVGVHSTAAGRQMCMPVSVPVVPRVSSSMVLQAIAGVNLYVSDSLSYKTVPSSREILF